MEIIKHSFSKIIAGVMLVCILLPFTVYDAEAAVGSVDFTAEDEYEPPEISSPCAFMMEMNTGAILYAKNADEPHAPASTIKSLTALVAIETADLSETLTFSENAIYDIEEGGENEEMRIGETMSLESCLKIMMMASCNEAAYCIAEHISGSLFDYAELMNARARRIGAVNSNFTNPHGLTDLEQYTTAHDLALIFAECVKNPVFMEIASLESTCVTDTTMKTYGYVYANHDKMMQPDSIYYRDYVRCGKTGFISQAGNTLVTYASQDGMDIVCAILQGESYDNVYNDTIALCDYAFANYEALNTAELLSGQVESIVGESRIVCDQPTLLRPNWLAPEDTAAEIFGMEKQPDAEFFGNASVTIGDMAFDIEFSARPLIDYSIEIIEIEEVIPPQPSPEPAEEIAKPADMPQDEEKNPGVVNVLLSVLLACFASVIVVLSILLAKARKMLKCIPEPAGK